MAEDALIPTPYTDWLRTTGQLTDLPGSVSVFDLAERDFWEGFGSSLSAVAAQNERIRLGLSVGEMDPDAKRRLDDFQSEALAFTMENPQNRFARMSSIYDELGAGSLEPQPRAKQHKGFLAGALDAGLKAAGNPFDKAFDALNWPSDRIEQVMGAGVFYAQDKLGINDIPDGISHWELGTLFYDMIAKNVTSQQTFLNKVSADLSMGFGMDEIRERQGSAWGDMIGKMIFDPLWLVGGLGLSVKSAEIASRSSKIARLVKHGLIGGEGAFVKLGRSRGYQALTELPFGLGRVFRMGSNVIGIPPLERELAAGTSQWFKVMRETVRYLNTEGTAGMATRLGFRYSRQTMATLAYQGAHDALRLPLAIAVDLTPREYIDVLEAVARNAPEFMPARLGDIARQGSIVDVGSKVLNAAGIKGADNIKAVSAILREAETFGD